MYLKLVATIFCFAFAKLATCQGVAVNTSGVPADASALLDVSGQKGILIPRLSTNERNLIAAPATALLIFNTEAKQFQVNVGTTVAPVWKTIVNMDSTNMGKQFWLANGNTGVDAQAFIGTIDNKPFTIKTNNTLRLYIDSVSNKVGIGTTEPKAALHINSTDAMIVPVGTTEQRPAAPVIGMIRYNSTIGKLEGYNTTGWVALN